jgi:hypothetical protein
LKYVLIIAAVLAGDPATTDPSLELVTKLFDSQADCERAKTASTGAARAGVNHWRAGPNGRTVLPPFYPEERMADHSSSYPFTLAVFPREGFAGYAEWAIRKHGRLIETSGRPCRTEQSAREQGQAALGRQLRVDREPPRSFRR